MAAAQGERLPGEFMLIAGLDSIRYAVRPQNVGIIHDADECHDETNVQLQWWARPARLLLAGRSFPRTAIRRLCVLFVFIRMRVAFLAHSREPVFIPTPHALHGNPTKSFFLLFSVQRLPEQSVLVHSKFFEALFLHYCDYLAG